LKLLDYLAGEGRTAFTATDVRECLGLSPQATSNLLARLATSGLVDRVAAGRYVIRPIGALGTTAVWDDLGSAVAAVFAGQPHRISFLTALDHHGLLVRPVRSVQVASPARPRPASLSGRPLHVIREQPATLYLGSEPLGPSRVSTAERALIDTASRPRLTGGGPRLAEALAAIERSSGLANLALQLGASAAYRRIGSIATTLHLPIAGDLQPTTWKSLVELDPTANRHRGWIDKDWGVAWPYPSSELEAVTAR
ncbi:MAG: type IV toxin-antitoxin system AbiEi family antitoxin domain-containing protein, partial [Candidatus Dormibacteraceae bacterium]